MTEPTTRAEVLLVAAKSQRAIARRLGDMLEAKGLSPAPWPDEDEPSGSSLAKAARRAGAIVILADAAIANGKLGDAKELRDALAPAADKLLVVAVDQEGLGAVSALKSADMMPARGSLGDLDAYGKDEMLHRITHEIAAEMDASYKPQEASHFDEYKLLFDSTERLVERRREVAQTFLAVNAAISAVVAFLAKDLSIGGTRLAAVTIPLFFTGMIACRVWRRTIRSYEALVDWRYRQLRRMERRRFVGSYRLFGREWDAIYAPRPRKSFGFSGLEAMVPQVFFSLHALGITLAILVALGLVDRLKP